MPSNSDDEKPEAREATDSTQWLEATCPPARRAGPKADFQEWTRDRLQQQTIMMMIDDIKCRSYESEDVQFWKGWAFFWNSIYVQIQSEVDDGLHAQLEAQLQARTQPDRQQLSIDSFQTAASIQPTHPPALSLSPTLTISLDPIEAASSPELNLSQSQTLTISIESTTSTKPTPPPQERLSISTIHTISIEPHDTPSHTCRRCHHILPTQAALIDHFYSNCRSPV
jgi:hypothetical protein